MARQVHSRFEVPVPVVDVFEFFAAAENLGRITPPELGFEILTPGPVVIRQGTIIDYRIRLFGVSFTWKTEITDWEPPHRFVDVQRRGPYRQWIHTHRFEPTPTGTVIVDNVDYSLPLAPFSELASPFVRMQLVRIFSYREAAVRRILDGKGPMNR